MTIIFYCSLSASICLWRWLAASRCFHQIIILLVRSGNCWWTKCVSTHLHIVPELMNIAHLLRLMTIHCTCWQTLPLLWCWSQPNSPLLCALNALLYLRLLYGRVLYYCVCFLLCIIKWSTLDLSLVSAHLRNSLIFLGLDLYEHMAVCFSLSFWPDIFIQVSLWPHTKSSSSFHLCITFQMVTKSLQISECSLFYFFNHCTAIMHRRAITPNCRFFAPMVCWFWE